MRELTIREFNQVAGGEDHVLTIVDPVAAIQTFYLMAALTDKEGFVYGSVITGMAGGTGVGGVVGYTMATGMGMAWGIGGAIVGGGVGMMVGGLAGKAFGIFSSGVYSTLMG